MPVGQSATGELVSGINVERSAVGLRPRRNAEHTPVHDPSASLRVVYLGQTIDLEKAMQKSSRNPHAVAARRRKPTTKPVYDADGGRICRHCAVNIDELNAHAVQCAACRVFQKLDHPAAQVDHRSCGRCRASYRSVDKADRAYCGGCCEARIHDDENMILRKLFPADLEYCAVCDQADNRWWDTGRKVKKQLDALRASLASKTPTSPRRPFLEQQIAELEAAVPEKVTRPALHRGVPVCIRCTKSPLRQTAALRYLEDVRRANRDNASTRA